MAEPRYVPMWQTWRIVTPERTRAATVPAATATATRATDHPPPGFRAAIPFATVASSRAASSPPPRTKKARTQTASPTPLPPPPLGRRDTPPAPGDLRARVQCARIERRWSVATLASRARASPEMLGAYERGLETLPPEVLSRVRHLLSV